MKAKKWLALILAGCMGICCLAGCGLSLIHISMLEQISGAHPQCRFIIVSGYEDQEYLKRALKLHVADYLTKPVDKAYLLSLIHI